MNGGNLMTLLSRRWWLLVLGLVPTVLVTYVQVRDLPPVYESVSTFVVRPVEVGEAEGLRALDTLSRGVEITSTYANIAKSDRIKEAALDNIGIPDGERGGISASGKVITGTYLLEISAQAEDPTLARDVAAAVSEESVDYINGLDNAFGLVALDSPVVSDSPVGPGTRIALLVAGLLGALLGLGMVVASGLVLPVTHQRRFDIVDRTTGAFTSSFLLMRLGEEMSRLRSRGAGALAVATLEPRTITRRAPLFPGLVRGSQLRRIADNLRPLLREGDVLAYVGGRRFAVLRPDVGDPDWPHQLAPPGTFKISVRTFVCGHDNELELLEDADTFVRHVEAELRRAAGDRVWGSADGRQPAGTAGL